ncbi:heparinase II/III family protein [bacterium]|nr:heparinase II/III family protein [bacterium]
MLGKIFKVIHTVKYLKPQQIAGQVVSRVRSRFSNPARLLNQSIPAAGQCCWPEGIDILPPGLQANSDCEILNGRLTFLNSTQEVGWMPDWQSEKLPKLWLYNLHYFEWLWSLEYKNARAVTLDWIENHQPARAQQGWEPYPISLRVMNLCGVFFAKYRSETEADDEFRHALWKSIYLQSEWLMSHLETHLLANHYLENGAALAFVGSCFEGPVAQRWMEKGLEILKSEIAEQILPDGMHFELSPMYHSRMLYVVMLLEATGNRRIAEVVQEPLKRMSRALSQLCHPDGQIALFNDSAFGIYNSPSQLVEYCSDLRTQNKDGQREGSFKLLNSGYFGWRDQRQNYLVCDAGPIGPDYQPGHAHADMFSFELSLHGCRVIVDSGIHDYENSKLRRYGRSTAAHNTVEIDEADQCELWGTFRVARRGIPKNIEWKGTDSGFRLSGSHSGYERLPGKPRHSREIQWDGTQDLMSVRDTVSARKSVKVVSRIHLHPDCFVREQREESLIIGYPKGQFRIDVRGPNAITVAVGWYFPEFGKKIQNTVIEIRSEGVKIESGYDVRSLKPQESP